jgi:ABC-2 type transport system permease protein
MSKYFLILRLFWASAVAAELEYRLNFVVAAITAVGNFAGSLFALSLFYQRSNSLGDWSWQEALLVMGLFTILEGLSSTMLAPNLNKIVQHVQKGTLDFILLKPVDSQMWLSLRNISLWGLPNVFLGVVLVIYAGAAEHIPLGYCILGLAPFFLSMVILYSLWFFLASLTIWFTKIYNLTEVLHGVMEAGRYPMAAYPAVWRFFFTFVIPVAFLTTVPAETALRRSGAAQWVAAEAVLALGLFLFARYFWRFALRFYTSASS